ncbi:hypothetical protein CRG98_023275 [Punica granatum]|uniref:Uncharacterized protein n=1 Tax=Punica granatum TaxID=22663 RepID=A0A2I0JL29_PUNGR|nr:hypothetical protein CRG98_023275 [Punica granatum]
MELELLGWADLNSFDQVTDPCSLPLRPQPHSSSSLPRRRLLPVGGTHRRRLLPVSVIRRLLAKADSCPSPTPAHIGDRVGRLKLCNESYSILFEGTLAKETSFSVVMFLAQPRKMTEHDEATGITEDSFEPVYTRRKRKKQSCADTSEFDDLDAGDSRLMKRIELALTRPSYLLCRGSKDVRTENWQRLWFLLHRLVRQQNWAEASGVLSVLLKATSRDRSPDNNRIKYSVLMEILDHVAGDRFNFTRIKHIFDVWMRRIGSRRKCSIQDRLAVHLEFILFCLIHGNISEAHQASIPITQESEMESYPMANVVVGLVNYQLWYSSIPKSMQRIDVEQLHSTLQMVMVDERFGSLAGNTEGHTALYSREANSHFQYDSDSSVMMDKRLSRHSLSGRLSEDMGKVEDLNEEPQLHNAQSHGFYINSTESEGSLSNDAKNAHRASVLPNLGALDPCVFPIRLPQNIEDIEELIELHRGILNDYYKDAVKYLQLALNSSPPGSDALLPLIQLLLIGGQVNEAFNVLENVCEKSETAFPFRLRAILLEHLDGRNYALLSSGYEHILKKDPTCRHSISRLVSMHQLGKYSVESLVEMIALHLDATNVEHSIWQELAMCFLKLTQQEEDCLSVCLNGGESGPQQRYSDRMIVIPKIFTVGNSGKAWRFRCRWWIRRYFSGSILKSDIATGDRQLLTNKAACAAHMYGQQFEYVSRTSDVLDQKEDREVSLFLQQHKQNSLGLHLYFQQNPKARYLLTKLHFYSNR